MARGAISKTKATEMISSFNLNDVQQFLLVFRLSHILLSQLYHHELMYHKHRSFLVSYGLLRTASNLRTCRRSRYQPMSQQEVPELVSRICSRRTCWSNSRQSTSQQEEMGLESRMCNFRTCRYSSHQPMSQQEVQELESRMCNC